MENLTLEAKQQLVEAFHSIIRKSEKALAHMKADAPQTRVLERRMQAARIGADTLLAHWEGRRLEVSQANAREAKQEMEGLLLTLPAFLDKQKAGSGQRTYLTRRIQALEVAVAYLSDHVQGD